MTYREVVGDLFEVGLPAVGHGCNVVGSMGGGVAKVVRQRFPDLYAQYVLDCASGALALGSFTFWQAPDVLIYNLGTQPLPGSNADLDAISRSVTVALADVAERGIRSLGLPRLGAGIGGLEWPDVKSVLRDAAAGSTVDLVVVTRR